MTELEEILAELLSLPAETECVEFKLAANDYDSRKLGKYFSALSNEANLADKSEAWLVLGVEDSDHAIVGTNYRLEPASLQSIKAEIAKHITDGITFLSVNELITASGKRVVMFKIPPAPRGIPVAYQGHYYARNGEELAALNFEKQERIRAQGNRYDWSREIAPEATIDDLSKAAIRRARELFEKKNPALADEIGSWSDKVFLNKAKLTLGGKITHAALILLGDAVSTRFLAPAQVQISWILKSGDGIEKDYEHFFPPFVLAVDDIYHKIRNLKYRYLAAGKGSLFPDEVNQYDPFTIREALNNCIVHQEYKLAGIVRVVEYEEDSLVFSNLGSFLPGNVESVIEADSPFEFYRNRFLAEAMVNLGMIDTIGSGIRRMFIIQKKKFFPLPDYKIDSQKVTVRIFGKVLDMDYAKKLARMPDLDLKTMILLDKIQKGQDLPPDAVKDLRSRGLIEGRKPNLIVSSRVASRTHSGAEYLKRRGVDDNYCRKMIVELIQLNGIVSRAEIDNLLFDKLAVQLTNTQKVIKIRNLLQGLRKQGAIAPTKDRKWVRGKKDLDEI